MTTILDALDTLLNTVTSIVSDITTKQPCPPLSDLGDWQALISFRPPTSVQSGLKHPGPTPDWEVHRIEDAKGPVNLDYYPVTVSHLPAPNGVAMTAEMLLDYIRRDINRFLSSKFAEFAPYDSSSETLWASPNPVGAVLHIDMNMGSSYANPDDGSVVCSEAASDHWIFSTIWTLGDQDHPVSGNRQFGFVSVADGSFVFYTRGADRTTGFIDEILQKAVFEKAHELWSSLIAGIASFVRTHGGKAQIDSPISCRYDWPSVYSTYHLPSTDWI